MAPIQIDPVGAFVDSLGDDVPSELQCGITGELFVDPVVNARGHTYERSAIEPWLITHQTDPLTREALPNRDLAPNWTVRHSLESFRARVLLIAPDAAAWMPPPPPPVTGGAAAALRPLPPDRGLRHRDPPGPPQWNIEMDALLAARMEAGEEIDPSPPSPPRAVLPAPARPGVPPARPRLRPAPAPVLARPPAARRPRCWEGLPWDRFRQKALAAALITFCGALGSFLAGGIGCAMLAHKYAYPGFIAGAAAGAVGGALVFAATEAVFAVLREEYGEDDDWTLDEPAACCCPWFLFNFVRMASACALGAALLPNLGLTSAKAAAAAATGAAFPLIIGFWTRAVD